MRSRRRLTSGLLLPACLIALVAVFAALQYRWLGQASEADREQMRRAINERARAFAESFDREIATAATRLTAEGGLDTPDAGEQMSARFERWRAAATFPAMVRGLYVGRFDERGEISLYRFSPEHGAFDEVAWPDTLAPVYAHLRPPEGGVLGMVGILPGTIISEVPALVMPARAPTPHVTIVELDAGVLRSEVLPALSRAHFPDQAPEPYRIAVLDASGDPVFTAGDAAGLRGSEWADAVSPLLQVRPEAMFDPELLAWRAGARVPGERTDFFVQRIAPPPDRERAAAGSGDSIAGRVVLMQVDRLERRVRMRGPDRWMLLVQHPAGSIDAAVHAGRRRNLWVSFGILSVLAAGVALVVVNARRAEQLAARQMEFVATVSHELRTPVAVMRSAAQNLSAGVVPDGERARRYGELIEREGRRLTEMVEQVLEFAGGVASGAAVAAQPVDAGAITREALDSCRTLTEAEGFAIDADICTAGEDVPVIHGDPAALRRAIVNLITNALKHGADRRWIGVTVRRAAGSVATGVEILVSDRGHGVDDEDLPHLFEPFYRGARAVEQQVQGSGLGLCLVQRIVEAHGGRITVDSAPGHGATFTVSLPA